MSSKALFIIVAESIVILAPMLQFGLVKALQLILALLILVTVHEFGHYIFAGRQEKRQRPLRWPH